MSVSDGPSPTANTDPSILTPTPANATAADVLKRELEELKVTVTAHDLAISLNTHLIQQEKLERQLQSMDGKFRIVGYNWQLKIFQGKETATRRRFVKQMLRVVFVNQGLMGEAELDTDPGPVSDCKPAAGWRDKAPLEVTFSDTLLYHAVKENL
jgi:hypothetical protein